MNRRAFASFLFLLLAALPATARELVIKNFDVHVTVNRDATIEVSEIIEAHFIGEWHGLYRTIPVEYTTPQGFNYTLFLEPLSVTDQTGSPLTYELSRQGNYKRFKIFVPGAVNATRTIILRYRVLDGLKFFPDHDELYWNVTGDEWEIPIEHASAQIELPLGVTGVRTLVFTGSYGSRAQDAESTSNNNQVRVRMLHTLAFHEGLTAVVGWDKGFVHEPGVLDKAVLFLRSNWAFAIPIGVFFLMFWLWWTRGRDPRRQPIAVQYEPPDRLTPAEAGDRKSVG